jgi:hypothetical protein
MGDLNEQTIISMMTSLPQELYGFKLAGEWKIPVYVVSDYTGQTVAELLVDDDDDDGGIAV